MEIKDNTYTSINFTGRIVYPNRYHCCYEHSRVPNIILNPMTQVSLRALSVRDALWEMAVNPFGHCEQKMAVYVNPKYIGRMLCL